MINKKDCALCGVFNLDGERGFIEHFSIQHYSNMVFRVIKYWETTKMCPVCDLILYNVINQRKHLETHTPFEVTEAAIESIRGIPLKWCQRPAVPRYSNAKRMGLDEFFW